jgi:hypothetical protein
MSARSGIIAVVLFAFVLGNVSADNKSIEGTVTASDGKPFANGEIRAQRLDAKAEPATTKTDAHGHYAFRGLPAGAYAITAYVQAVPKSRANVKTRSDGWAKVDFDLRLKTADVKEKRKYVWVKGEPGSHIGGRWVPVDEPTMPTTSAVDTVGGDDVNRMQRDMRINTNANMGAGSGH